MFSKGTLCTLLGLFFLASLDSVLGECNVCSGFNNLACVSQTEFQVCVNSIPTGGVTLCPTNYVCSTATSVICQPSGAGVVASCNDCFKCDSTGTFACTGSRTYALCLGGTTPGTLTGTCAPNHYCNINYPQICGAIDEGILPTCSILDDNTSTTTAVPTTPSPITNPTGYCQTVRENGRFPVGNNVTSTCRQYVYCSSYSGLWSGALYNCPGNTYFYSSSRQCGVAIPSNCNTNVQNFMLFNSVLLIEDS